MKNIIYDITKLAERFLEVEKLNSDNNQRMINLLEKLSEKHLSGVYLSKYNTHEKNYFISSKFHDDFYQDYLALKKSKSALEAYNPRLRSKLLSKEIAEIMIFDFIVKSGNNFNNIYIEESEYNELPDNDFVKMFSKLIFNSNEFEKYLETLSTGSVRHYKVAIVFF